jgi:thiol-disulfide isomerase/thioredoxin
MKKYLLVLLFAIICTHIHAQGYQITVQIPQYKSGICYLTYHLGKNFNVEDSAAVSNKGVAIFKKKTTLPGGIYAIVLPGRRLSFDFFVDKEQRIDIKADTTDLINKTVVTGSKENIIHQQYQKYTFSKGQILEKERKAYITATTKADSALHDANYIKNIKELNNYRSELVKKNPTSMMAALLNAMKEPTVPKDKPVTRLDSVNNYNYYKNHYWDGITFMDERIIRTPFFLPKIERYYNDIVIQPDSVIKDIDYKLLLARSSPEMYKFLLNWLTDYYINPKYMGQDAVFVHLFEKYHSKGLTSWLNEKQMEAISRRAYMLMSNLVGAKAANLEMIDSTGKAAPLYGIDADYMVVVFWDPNCGHCKTEVPKIDSIYHATWQQKNVKLYGVLTPEKEDVKADWIKFNRENKLTDWTHVYSTKEMEAANYTNQKPSFRQLYDINMTPTLYLLNKEKRIVGKKLTWEQINELLQVKWANKN